MTDDAAAQKDAPTGLAALVAKLKSWRPVRTALYYLEVHGPLLASGLTYQAIFAVFAAIWVAFTIAALIIGRNLGLRAQFLTTLSDAVPGLIQDASGNGAIDPDMLLSAGTLSGTGAIALAGLLFTALGWLASARDSVRSIFDIGPISTPFLLLKAKDLGLAVGFGAVLIVSTVLSAVSTALLSWVLGLLGFDSDSTIATIIGRISTGLIVLAIDTAVLAALFRILSGVHIPRRRLFPGSLLGGVGLGLLKLLGGSLIGGGTRNPLLASFAVIVGLLIFFNIVCQLVLIAAAWIAVGMKDDGIAADPAAAAREAAERERIAALERDAAKARRPGVLAKLLWPFRRGRTRSENKVDAAN